MLISEAQREERYISYFHKPMVQGWTTPSSSWRRWRSRWRRWRPRRQRPARVFPLQSAAPGLLFHGIVFLRSSPPKAIGGLFLLSFLGQDEGTEMKTDGIGATRGREVLSCGQGIWPRGTPQNPPRTSFRALPWLLHFVPSKK